MRNKYWILLLVGCCLLVACKKKQPYRIPPYVEKPTEGPSFQKPQLFPEGEKTIKLLKLYELYKEKYNYDSLAELYAPTIEQYDDIYHLTRNDVIYYTRRKIDELGQNETNILWSSVIINPLSSTRARVSFITNDDYRNRLNSSCAYFIFKQLEINENYQIVSEISENFVCENWFPDWNYDYSPVDELIELHDEPQPYEPDLYTPCTITVPNGSTIQEAVYQAMPYLCQHEKKYGVGGAKLLGELSADKAGINTSTNIPDEILCLMPLNVLKVEKNDDPYFVYNLVCSGKIRIGGGCTIGSSRDQNTSTNVRVIYIGPQPDDDIFRVNITLENLTDNEIGTNIPEGTMIEAVNNDVQNVVTTSYKYVTIPPHQSKRVSIPAVCAAKKRKDPTGSLARITPYKLIPDDYNRYTQESVWQYQSQEPNNRLVFYAYGKGLLRDGRKSETGHAFVYVPELGYIGFGTKKLNRDVKALQYMELILGTDGAIFDHNYHHQLATDSCEVYITDDQLRHVQSVLRDYMVHTPPYRLGRYDCTSFVMDIADAGGIQYGYRNLIQTPIGFMEELKKRN